MDERLSLSALLSHALVAFTIEFDNAFEHEMPHRTTRHGSTPGSHRAPWLVSLVMWMNCMRFVREEGVGVQELRRLARTTTILNGMERWGYIVVEPIPFEAGTKRPRPEWLIRPKPAGRMAQAVWKPLFGIIEGRWQERFGEDLVGQLRESLSALITQLDIGLPDCLPILGYGLYSAGPEQVLEEPGATEFAKVTELPLVSLLSKALLAFALEFERSAKVSLAISANVLRNVNDRGVRVRDLPRLSGVSKEAIATSVSFLEKQGYATVTRETPRGRAKVLVLTAKGRLAKEDYLKQVGIIEERWKKRFGMETVGKLRDALERLTGDATAKNSPLFRGLKPYPDGWRASVPEPEYLPHYPMVSHRGGFPDGS